MCKISYIFRDEAPVSDDKVVAGMCYRVDDRNWTLHKQDFIIEISKDIWDDASDQFKEALMFHELKHCAIRLDKDGQPGFDDKSGRLKTGIHKHDVEEFNDVLDKYGTFNPALRKFLQGWTEKKKQAKTKKDETIDTSLDGDLALD